MSTKLKYRGRNWKDYNQALRNRGNISVWITPEALSTPPKKSGRGRPSLFTDGFIQMALTLRYIFRMPLRATQGLLDFILEKHGVDKRCCDYSLLSKRALAVNYNLITQLVKTRQVVHLVVDSTGLKVFGCGEWRAKRKGEKIPRLWKKLHLAVDADSFEIVNYALTDKDTNDGQVFDQLLSPITEIDRCYADGAYDQLKCYETIIKKHGRVLIPPRNTSKPRKKYISCEDWFRGLNVNDVHRLGLAEWKKKSGYFKRNLAETSMHRFKRCLGEPLWSRKTGNQETEVSIKCLILNHYAKLGMPITTPA